MLYFISQKLELDIMQASELEEAMELAHVHRMNAVVVHPDLVADALMQRVKRQAKYRILTTVDWPKGDKSSVAKFHSMSIHSLSCDGFEIALGVKSQGETKAETLAITEFIRRHLPAVHEIRFVLGCLSREQEEIERLCMAIREVPAPNFLRTDINLRCAQAKANIAAHVASLTAIRACINRPIKLCGNINSAKIVASCKADRYGVSLKQAQTIIKELKDNPAKIDKLFR
jgi:deoxyribose-phosphate aldolase